MRRALAFLALAVLGTAGAAHALMVEVPLDRLVAGSEAVVQARVVTVESHWTGDRSTIGTDVLLSVEESWFGAHAAGVPLRLQVEGGEVGDVGVWVEHQPRFTAGEHVLLFLATDPSARLRVNALEQGKFRLEGDGAVGWTGKTMPLAALRAAVTQLKSAPNR